MSVFRNYNSNQAGGVNANAFPRVHPIPWIPSQRNVRANPAIPSQPQRIQPHERGTFYPTSATGGGTLAPQMSSSGGCGCGGGGGCGGGNDSSATPTASDLATGHTQPLSTVDRSTHVMSAMPRVQARGVGAIRPSLPRNNVVRTSTPRLMTMSLLGGRGTR